MMSRKVRPSRTSNAVFGPDRPMLVPSPPLSLITTVRDSASARSPSVAARSPSSGVLPSSSIVDSGMVPVVPDSSSR